jgi:hypothetical protein
MTLAQWISTFILMFWPILFAASFWFFELPKRQRQALAQFAPIAAKQMKKRDSISYDANMQLALNFVAKAFKASKLPHYSEDIVRAAIESEL